MNMDFIAEYKSKLGTPEQAAALVKSGDWVEYGNGTTFAELCDAALAKRRDELWDVNIRGQIMYGPMQAIECDPTGEHFTFNSWHASGYERKLMDRGQAYFSPMIFRNLAWYHKEFLHVNVAFVTCPKSTALIMRASTSPTSPWSSRAMTARCPRCPRRPPLRRI